MTPRAHVLLVGHAQLLLVVFATLVVDERTLSFVVTSGAIGRARILLPGVVIVRLHVHQHRYQSRPFVDPPSLEPPRGIGDILTGFPYLHHIGEDAIHILGEGRDILVSTTRLSSRPQFVPNCSQVHGLLHLLLILFDRGPMLVGLQRSEEGCSVLVLEHSIYQIPALGHFFGQDLLLDGLLVVGNDGASLALELVVRIGWSASSELE
mmetsp:Transcript_17875/g.42243  ORF Transcript_17875/g.42243 Transcript_17875/m.42243 type:complete len:208 (+) Transcript_17875:258-881(+)